MAILKRLEAPGFWPIEKKTKKYTVALLPGPHPREAALTIAVVIRDMLKHAETLREAKQILNSGAVKVDGVARKMPGFPVGLMDIVSVGEEHYRLLPGKRGFFLKPAGQKEMLKLRKITGKTTVNGGRTQLHFHDGFNLLAEDKHRTGDVAVFNIADNKITGVIRQQKGSRVIVTKGRNMGAAGLLEEIKVTKGIEPNTATISAGGRTITLPLDYIFAVGEREPVISLGEQDEQRQ